MYELSSYQRKYLRGLAHGLKPVVFIGHKGMTDTVSRTINEALASHELIKIKFIDFKEKDQKKKIAHLIEKKTMCNMVGMIGHIGMFFKPHHDPEKRKIKIPNQK
ncbi:MAG: YhbY family RNA-binding protein [Desulfobacula sp.]|nr:YhbY family RNA-binding protein [Desulfobacula sp.]